MSLVEEGTDRWTTTELNPSEVLRRVYLMKQVPLISSLLHAALRHLVLHILRRVLSGPSSI